MLRTLTWVVLFILVAVVPAWSLDLTPFAVRNLSPPALVHGLTSAEPARLNLPGQVSVRLGFDLANSASLSQTDTEKIRMDGETTVMTIGMRYGLTDRLQIGFDLPWISHSEGSLDSFIQNWHDFFGLPNGDRDNLPDDNLNYSYEGGHGDSFLLDRQTSGLADIKMFLAWQWLAENDLAVSLHGALKAPTGEADDLTGSGAWDAALALSAQRDFAGARGDISIWGGLGANWLGEGDLVADRGEDWAASGWTGIGWGPLDWLAFKLQADAHSALYDSKLAQLGDPALILTMGGTLALGQRTTLDMGVGEDLAVSASPDVTFHLGLAHKF